MLILTGQLELLTRVYWSVNSSAKQCSNPKQRMQHCFCSFFFRSQFIRKLSLSNQGCQQSRNSTKFKKVCCPSYSPSPTDQVPCLWWLALHGCSNHSNLEMEAECLTKTLSYLNLNISRTKTADKQAVKSARIKKIYHRIQGSNFGRPGSFGTIRSTAISKSLKKKVLNFPHI